MANKFAQFRPHLVDLTPSDHFAIDTKRVRAKQSREASFKPQGSRLSTLIIRIIGPKNSNERSSTRAFSQDGMVSIPVRSKASRTAHKLARRKPPARPETHPVFAAAPPERRTGAVRTSSAPKIRRSSNSIGRGITLAITVIAAFGWIVGATTTESEKAQSHTVPASPIARASDSPPVFFFDDNEDALAQLASIEQKFSPISTIHAPETEKSPVDLKTVGPSIDTAKEETVASDSIDPDGTAARTALMGALDAADPLIEADEAVKSDKQDGIQSSPVPLVFDPKNRAGSTVKASMGKSKEAAIYTKPVSLPSPAVPGVAATDTEQLTSRGEIQNSATPSMVTSALTVMPGDTLSGILNEQGVGIEKMPPLLNDQVIKDHLSNLEVGQKFELTRKNGEFYDLRARVGREKLITIKQSSAGLDISVEELPTRNVEVVTAGTIEQSLYLAAEKAQLKQSTIMKLAEIFQWELDFAKDIRKGDKFSLIFNKQYRGGEYVRDGEILAAQFVRGGKTHTAIRFTSEDGNSAYYSPDGKSKQRTFLRHPVDNVRITSRFNPNRMHPLLQKVRAHRGVDYGAPYGSPIFATADGKVDFSGFKNSFGNMVILKHGEKTSTLYAHMSKISGKARPGKNVRQGDVIGYVGKSGRVTGVHLHYEFRINGVHVDPLTVELPEANSIEKKYLNELSAQSKILLRKMQTASKNSNQSVAQATGKISSDLVAKRQTATDDVEFK